MYFFCITIILCTSLCAMEPYTFRRKYIPLHDTDTHNAIQTIADMPFYESCTFINNLDSNTQLKLFDVSNDIPELCARLVEAKLPPEDTNGIKDYVLTDMHPSIKTFMRTKKINNTYQSIAYDPHNSHRLACHTHQEIYILNHEGTIIAKAPFLNELVTHCAFDPHNPNTLAYTQANRIIFWQFLDDIYSDLITTQHQVTHLSFSPHTPNQIFFITNNREENRQGLWKSDLQQKGNSTLLFCNAYISSFALHNTRNTIAIANRPHEHDTQSYIHSIDFETQKAILSPLFECEKMKITTSSYHEYLIAGVGSTASKILLFDTRDQKLQTISIEEAMRPHTICFSPHNSSLLSLGTYHNGTQFYDIRTHKKIHTILCKNSYGDNASAFNPHNEKKFGICGSDSITLLKQNPKALHALNTLSLQKALYMRKYSKEILTMSEIEFSNFIEL